jgi:hypothetical protein
LTAFFGLSALPFFAVFAFFTGEASAALGASAAGGFGPAVFAAVVLALVGGAAESPWAASLSDATALSRALVAVVIAASAVVSAFADVPACVAAVFSRVAADVTLVAAAETVRGVTVPVLLALPVAVLLAAGRAVVPVFVVAVAGLAAAAPAGGLPAASVVPGMVAVVFVGTDSPPIWISYGGVIPRRVTSYT